MSTTGTCDICGNPFSRFEQVDPHGCLDIRELKAERDRLLQEQRNIEQCLFRMTKGKLDGPMFDGPGTIPGLMVLSWNEMDRLRSEVDRLRRYESSTPPEFDLGSNWESRMLGLKEELLQFKAAALSAERELSSAAACCNEIADERNRLRAWKEDVEATHKKIMEEQCPPDERHCTCVPTLRGEIERLRADVYGLRLSEEKQFDACKTLRKTLEEIEERTRPEGDMADHAVHELASLALVATRG